MRHRADHARHRGLGDDRARLGRPRHGDRRRACTSRPASGVCRPSLSDPARRGEYQGVSRLGYTLGSVWAPAAYTYLAVERGAVGWLLIAALVVAAAAVLHPAARAAERHLARPVTS
nr:hypothetical protein [Angustibacter aerolatus]